MADYVPPKAYLPPVAIVAKAEKPKPVAPKGFRSGDYWAGHDCPNCHNVRWIIDTGSGNRIGSHTHTCPFCQVSWWHVGP